MAATRRRGLGLACAGLLGCGPGSVASEGGGSEAGESGEHEPDVPALPDLPAPAPACAPGAGYGLLGPPAVILAGIPDYLVPSDLVATDEGLLALMLWGVTGEPDRPRAWAVGLDAHGAALTEPFALFDRRVASTDGPRAYPTDDGFMLTFCASYGPEEMAASIPIDGHGLALGPDVRRSPARSCGPGVPNGIWTGARHLVAWRDNSTGPEPEFELLVDRFDANGSSTGWLQLQPDGELIESRFVLTTAGLFLLSSNQVGDGLELHRFDALGNLLADATVTLPVPDGVALSDVAIAADHAGVVAWMYDRSSPHASYRWHVDPDGEHVDGPIPVELPHTYLVTDIAARPGGGFVAAGSEIDGDIGYAAALVLDSTGAVIEALRLDPDPHGSFARVTVRGGSVFVLYELVVPGDEALEAELGEDLDTSDLRVVELGCLDGGAP